jgi:LCP family protein required for cell wall assembly
VNSIIGAEDRLRVVAGVVAVLTLFAGIAGALTKHAPHHADIVIGKARAEATFEPPEPGPPERPVPHLIPSPLLGPSGSGPGGALAFRGAVNVPKDLLFLLIIGSDARPGEDVTRSRGDSIHIAVIDPSIRQGTILGLPRDSYVDVPGHGRRKINSSLALGGPDLMVQAVRNLTGFPIQYYAVTGFDGMVHIADELHGADIQVPYRMDDRQYSGANFEAGWHHMDGKQVLAFSRDRHSLPNGDFGRSFNQGTVILDSLLKLRHETSDESGIRRWLSVLYRHARLDMSLANAVRFGLLARQIAPASLRNIVAPGQAQNVNGQSVVVLSDQAYALFRDVGADALADGRTQRRAPPPTPAPTPQPTPSPSPPPAPIPSASPSSRPMPIPTLR